MMARLSPALLAFGGSIVLLGGLIGTLVIISNPGNSEDGSVPLEIHCAAALRLPIEAIAADYEKEYGQKVLINPGKSQTILIQLQKVRQGDLFLPADDSYIETAKKDDLIDRSEPVARMKPVVIVRPGFEKEIKTWDDFVAAGNKVGITSDGAAIDKVVKEHLKKIGKWASLQATKPAELGDVNEVGNAVAKTGAVDVGITWDALAETWKKKAPGVKIVRLAELDAIEAKVQIAITKCSKQHSNALRFVGFLNDRAESSKHLTDFGFTLDKPTKDKNPPVAKNAGPRELTLYAGSMLRPALEEALTEFEKRENCKIIRVYNGCGILVTQMNAGQMPDMYFACDTSFMVQVKDRFELPINVSNNQLVIAVKKGNPHDVTKLLDLGKPNLKVGVGHEHQCALGALTKETFIRSGVYAKVMKNVVVQSPSGDLLINQLRVGALDAVVAYRSNVLPYPKDLDSTPIEGIPCATPSQPLAVSKNSAHPELTQRLMEFLVTEQSRRRFENAGFGWEAKKGNGAQEKK